MRCFLWICCYFPSIADFLCKLQSQFDWKVFLVSAKVENNKACQKWLLSAYKDSGTCLYRDIFSMVENRIPQKTLLKVKQVKWKSSCFCLAHDKECHFTFKDTLLVLGTPCVLFSKFLGFIMRAVPHLRLGKREKYRDTARAQCQAVGAAAMAKAAIAVHENVLGFDPSLFNNSLGQKLHLAVLLGLQRPHSPHPASGLFGSPTSRPREYRITHDEHHRWASALWLSF